MTREDLEVTRWRGFTHAELYAQLHSGPGATASAVPSRRWADLATTMQDISQDMTKAIADAKAMWAGAAANSAYAQLGEVAAWAGRTGDEAEKMRASVDQQADHIGRARAAMPAPGEEPTPQPDPAVAPVAQLLAMQKDHEVVERATTDAARRAFEVMEAYQNDTTSTTDALASFDESVDTSGHHGHNQRHRGGVLGFSEQTRLSGAGPDFTPTPDHHRNFWETPHSRGGQTVSQAGAQFLPMTESRFQPATPLQPGVAAGADPLGSPVAATPRREPSARKGSITGKLPVTASSLDAGPIPGAAPPAGSHVSPAAATSPAGSSSERLVPRRGGEQLIPSQWADDAVEPANQAKRRRDRTEQEKITESVEGAEAEVPPPVIGNGPYRQ
ncbi:hypothetical protein JOF56_003162 [Kibdelosporangium banguiense]|uniref:PPE domain-containing protein n=1 Tax=Kibdelosporangium banguiense TaxID=1365924 RepID=A0ABS4TED3_9PSEU|nr:hypothetical protein [Kibdelosporangium banguiense]MBP2322777.1 hypothetical protein [Kibdelosporangium banguiense]